MGNPSSALARGSNSASADLPSADVKRWSTLRKAAIVSAIRASLIGEREACQLYGISIGELNSWKTMLDRHGTDGLRTTRVQHYRGSRNSTD